MNWARLEKKLIAAARKNLPSNHTPYAFEQRVMTLLKSREREDQWAWWSRALWMGAGACAAIALATSVWSFKPDERSDAASSFSHGLEQTLFASAEEPENTW